ncbi:MAG: hypothetical protein ABI042_18425 [Verrucomicrobiota bacterium]
MFWPGLAALFFIGIFAVHSVWRKKFMTGMKMKERELAQIDRNNVQITVSMMVPKFRRKRMGGDV